MIFFLTGAAALILSFFIIKIPWNKTWAKWIFAVNMLSICAILVLLGLDFKVWTNEPAAGRRIIIAAVDVSASTGINAEEFTAIASDGWDKYSLEVIPFSDAVRGAEGAEATGMIESIKSILSYVSAANEDKDIAAFTVITDGNETEQIDMLRDDLETVGKYPHNVIYLSKDGIYTNFDKSVMFRSVPGFISDYSRETVSFSVCVIGAKFEGVPVELRLNGKNIGTTFVHLENGYGEGKYEISIKRPGMNLLEAYVALDSRERITDNNRDYASIKAVRKGVRVLHISGHPSADTAFIRRGLQNIPGVDMISFYILRGNSQIFKTTENELSLIPFPTDQLFRDELDNFDLIIINDFKLSVFLNQYYINNIVKFAESGGGLIIFGGPESFTQTDYLSNNFESILPVHAGDNNFDDKEYIIRKNQRSELTPLGGLREINNMKFRGLNRVNVKNWASVFYHTADGLPVIAGGIKGKARVVALLSDSFWRFSYNAGLSNEEALKSLLRYSLGISTMPADILGTSVSFDKKYISISDNSEIYARIRPFMYDGSIEKEKIIHAGESFDAAKLTSMLLDLTIEEKGKVIDKYELLNYREKSRHEHLFVPMGGAFLRNFTANGGGEFITASGDLNKDLKKIRVREPVIISEKNETFSPIYKNKVVLVLFLYLVLSSFYLKSRYCDTD